MSMCGGAARNVIFENLMDREINLAVFDKMLKGAPAPFAGAPDLRPEGIDTAKNPTWLLFGWSHKHADFVNHYGVAQNPFQGDRGFPNLISIMYNIHYYAFTARSRT